MSKMPRPTEETLNDRTEEFDALKREDIIRAEVLVSLGNPHGKLRVKVVPLWGNYFRVNVLIRDEMATVKIPNSYFVTSDDNGKILRTEPPIHKLS